MAGEEGEKFAGPITIGYQLNGDMELEGYYAHYTVGGGDPSTFSTDDPQVFDGFLRGFWEGFRCQNIKVTNK